MSQIYRSRRAGRTAPLAQKAQAASGPSLRELAAGAMPTPEQMGRRVDLPGEIREKMEASFGADFSGVKLYESQTVADAGAEAMTQGQNIAFAPGRLDLTGTAGQALLGHELSHVVSQARGESAGHGFLADPGLEARADRQGMLAAQGESVYSGPVSPVGVSSAAAASGPMQAKKDITKAKEQAAREKKSIPSVLHPIERAKAKKYYLNNYNKRQEMVRRKEALKDEFHGIEMGDTEESRRAGRQQQIEMLLNMMRAQESLDPGNDRRYSDNNSLGDAMSELIRELSQQDNGMELVDDLTAYMENAAQEAMENYNSGVYGAADDPETEANLKFSDAADRAFTARSLRTTMGASAHPDSPVRQKILELSQDSRHLQGPMRDLNSHIGEGPLRRARQRIGDERFEELQHQSDAARTAQAEEWYLRRFGSRI